MRALFLVGLALVVSASALVEVGFGYHQKIGIPAAEKIRLAEEKIVAEAAQGDRIVGGSAAPANAHPYFAFLLISLVGITGQSLCGSSILSANRLVTAAHCWNDGRNQAWQFIVILGSNHITIGGISIATSDVVMHPQFTSNNIINDIAMILLPVNVPLSPSIRPIALPSGTNQYVGNWAVAAGFGRTSDQEAGVSSILNHVNLQVISLTQCQMTYGSNVVINSTLCTSGVGGVGVCAGDNGGPLVLNYHGVPTLIGISSFNAGAGCEAGFPSGFARVNSFLDFIQQYM